GSGSHDRRQNPKSSVASAYSRKVKHHQARAAGIRVGISPYRRAIGSGRRGAGWPAVAHLPPSMCLPCATPSKWDGGDGGSWQTTMLRVSSQKKKHSRNACCPYGMNTTPSSVRSTTNGTGTPVYCGRWPIISTRLVTTSSLRSGHTLGVWE